MGEKGRLKERGGLINVLPLKKRGALFEKGGGGGEEMIHGSSKIFTGPRPTCFVASLSPV